MPQYDLDSLVRDPDFQGRSFSERKAILREADAEGFGTLPEAAQSRMLVDMKGQEWWTGGKSAAKAPQMTQDAALTAWQGKGKAKPVDTRKVNYTGSGYTPNQPAKSGKEFARNLVQDVVELPLMPVRMLSDVANSPDTPQTLMELGKGLVRGPLEFVPGVGEALGGRSATEAWSTNPGYGGMTLAGLGAAAKPIARGGKALREKTRPAPTELQTLSEQHGVPLTAGETLNSPNMKQIESRLERLPALGIRGFRKKQGESLAKSAQALSDEFATPVEDPATAIVDRFKSNLRKGKDESSQAYAKIDEALAANGDVGAIQPNATRTQLKTLLQQSPDIFERLPGSQNRLKSIMAEIAGDTAPKKQTIPVAGEQGLVRGGHGTKPEAKVLLGPDGKPITKTTPVTLKYEDYTWLRSQLGEYIDRAHSSAGAVGSNELRQLTLIKKALDNDFYNWGKNSGYDNVTAAVDNARNVYKTKVAPFENVPVLKSIVNDKFTPEQVLDAIAKPGQATLATRALRGMREGDKALVQDAIMRRAMALSTEGAVNGAPISGAKFASFFEKMDTKTKNAAKSPMDVFYTPEQKQLVMGFAKLARAAERSSQYSANPLTGVAAADFAIPGAIGGMAAAVGAPAAMTAAGFTKAMSLLLTTKSGKSLLSRAYHTPAGAKSAWGTLSADMQRILKDERGMVGKDIDTAKPLELYRGDSVNPDGLGKGSVGDLGKGHYFTDASFSAEYFTDGTNKSHVRNFEVPIKKTFDLMDRDIHKKPEWKAMVDTLPEDPKYGVKNRENLDMWAKGKLDVKNVYGFLARSFGQTPETFNDFLAKFGFDSVKDQGIRGIADGGGQYVIFDPSKVKERKPTPAK